MGDQENLDETNISKKDKEFAITDKVNESKKNKFELLTTMEGQEHFDQTNISTKDQDFSSNDEVDESEEKKFGGTEDNTQTDSVKIYPSDDESRTSLKAISIDGSDSEDDENPSSFFFCDESDDVIEFGRITSLPSELQDYRNKTCLVQYSDSESECETKDSSDYTSSSSSPEDENEDENDDDNEDEGIVRDDDNQIANTKSNKNWFTPPKGKEAKDKSRSHGEIFPEELPPIDYLNISAPEDIVLEHLGHVSGIVDVLVIIQAQENSPALYDDTVLFLEDRQPLGLVFETIGTVEKPFYTIRFNSNQDILDKSISIGDKVLFAPRADNLTTYVFVAELKKMKAYDDCGLDGALDDESQDKFFSDDEAEKEARRKEKKRKLSKKKAERENAYQNPDRSRLLPGHASKNPFRGDNQASPKPSKFKPPPGPKFFDPWRPPHSHSGQPRPQFGGRPTWKERPDAPFTLTPPTFGGRFGPPKTDTSRPLPPFVFGAPPSLPPRPGAPLSQPTNNFTPTPHQFRSSSNNHPSHPLPSEDPPFSSGLQFSGPPLFSGTSSSGQPPSGQNLHPPGFNFSIPSSVPGPPPSGFNFSNPSSAPGPPPSSFNFSSPSPAPGPPRSGFDFSNPSPSLRPPLNQGPLKRHQGPPPSHQGPPPSGFDFSNPSPSPRPPSHQGLPSGFDFSSPSPSPRHLPNQGPSPSGFDFSNSFPSPSPPAFQGPPLPNQGPPPHLGQGPPMPNQDPPPPFSGPFIFSSPSPVPDRLSSPPGSNFSGPSHPPRFTPPPHRPSNFPPFTHPPRPPLSH